MRQIRRVRHKDASIPSVVQSFGGPIEVTQGLLRGVRAEIIASGWHDPQLERCAAFWDVSSGRTSEEDYRLSENVATQVDMFISHTWGAPPGWARLMGKTCSFTEMKATELCNAAKDLCERSGGTYATSLRAQSLG